MLLEFLRRLCGPECQALNVTGREKLGWHPRQMLSHTMELLLACVHHSPSRFVATLQTADTYELGILERAATILEGKCQLEFAPMKLDALKRLLATLRQAAAGGAAAAETSITELALAAAKEAEGKESASQLLGVVDAAYKASLCPDAYGEAEMGTPERGYEHYYKQNIADCPVGSIAPTKLKRLMRELKKLSKAEGGGEGALPVAAEAAIFALQDESRMDVLKVIVSGPADLHDRSRETPYARSGASSSAIRSARSGRPACICIHTAPAHAFTPPPRMRVHRYALGLFEFHMFIPPDYPAVPPLVNLQVIACLIT